MLDPPPVLGRECVSGHLFCQSTRTCRRARYLRLDRDGGYYFVALATLITTSRPAPAVSHTSRSGHGRPQHGIPARLYERLPHGQCGPIEAKSSGRCHRASSTFRTVSAAPLGAPSPPRARIVRSTRRRATFTAVAWNAADSAASADGAKSGEACIDGLRLAAGRAASASPVPLGDAPRGGAGAAWPPGAPCEASGSGSCGFEMQIGGRVAGAGRPHGKAAGNVLGTFDRERRHLDCGRPRRRAAVEWIWRGGRAGTYGISRAGAEGTLGTGAKFA